jgi:hypothetical protein
MPVAERIQLLPGRRESKVSEVSAHCATDDFRVPEVNCAGEGNGRTGAQRGGRAEDRADVARVLDGVEDEEAAVRTRLECVQRPVGYLGDRQHALRGFRLGRAGELALVDVGQLETAGEEVGAEGSTPWGAIELRRDQDAANAQWRAYELLDGTNAFGDEEMLALARFAPSEIPR